MTGNSINEVLLRWTGVFSEPDDTLIQDVSQNPEKYKRIFTDQIAGYLYEDMRRARMLITSPFTFNKEFSRLNEEEKRVWYDYASEIPVKLKSLNLFIRPFRDFCRTCIITDSEIEKLACFDHDHYVEKARYSDLKPDKNINIIGEKEPHPIPFQKLPAARKWYFKELNYLIPPQLRKIGFEIVRPDEISLTDPVMIKKLARAVHARYLREMRNRGEGDDLNQSDFRSGHPGDQGNQYVTDFENLPEDIKYSNKDNACHITTKLLAI